MFESAPKLEASSLVETTYSLFLDVLRPFGIATDSFVQMLFTCSGSRGQAWNGGFCHLRAPGNLGCIDRPTRGAAGMEGWPQGRLRADDLNWAQSQPCKSSPLPGLCHH